MILVDLHMHSSASDGTDDIQELLSKVRSSGIRIFSLTDHDTISGALEMEKLVPDDMVFIRGIEFSCITSAGKCHILAYGYDPNNQHMIDILEEGRQKRKIKLETRIKYLQKKHNINFTAEELSWLRSKDGVGKPHLGNILIKKGIKGDLSSVIRDYINPCKTESTRLNGEKVIEEILASGGIPVWAHPYGGTGEKEITMDSFNEQLHILKAAGLVGLECYYSKYSMKQIRSLIQAADENDLRISGGSDYHGKNKAVSLCQLNADGETITADRLTILDSTGHCSV